MSAEYLDSRCCFCRPFGCGVILGGYDRDGPQLYMIEPSGISYVSGPIPVSHVFASRGFLYVVHQKLAATQPIIICFYGSLFDVI